jgi:hypothetical protein
MTCKQKQEVLELIAKDCERQYIYLAPESGKTCALGHLARAAGVSDDILMRASIMSIDSVYRGGSLMEQDYRAVEIIRDAIKDRFGLTLVEMQQIQKLNDNHNATREQRVELITRYIQQQVCDL